VSPPIVSNAIFAGRDHPGLTASACPLNHPGL